MPDDNSSPRETDQAQTQTGDELVKKVSEKVYAMLLQDLTIELERSRPSSIHSLITRGGW
ncbi:MAG: hypothetical protein P1S60_03850 [Anaerolineae bacterium]|nr:hypothetical protein [Anaerolineae bacterium]